MEKYTSEDTIVYHCCTLLLESKKLERVIKC